MRLVVGVDEVGRGPLAGPVVAAAACLPQPIDGLADSKKLSAARREVLAVEIRTRGMVALGAASVREIDRLNILHASLLAMRRAVDRLARQQALEIAEVLVDGNRAPKLAYATRCIVGGDATVPEISAASIVAKVVRDHIMTRLALRYGNYGWERNAGYGTPEHLAGMARAGVTVFHRRSFRPVREALDAAPQPEPGTALSGRGPSSVGVG